MTDHLHQLMDAGGCALIPFWLVLKDPVVCFFPPSPSRPAQALHCLICPAVLPATTTRRASCTEATVSPALRPETLDQRWTGSRRQSPSPAAVAALWRRMSQRSLTLLLDMKMEEKAIKKRMRERCWRASLRERRRLILRIRPPLLFHT